LGRCVGGRHVHDPMADCRRHVHHAMSAQNRVTTGQDV